MPALPDHDRRDAFHTALEESVDIAGLDDNDYRRLGAHLISFKLFSVPKLYYFDSGRLREAGTKADCLDALRTLMTGAGATAAVPDLPALVTCLGSLVDKVKSTRSEENHKKERLQGFPN